MTELLAGTSTSSGILADGFHIAGDLCRPANFQMPRQPFQSAETTRPE